MKKGKSIKTMVMCCIFVLFSITAANSQSSLFGYNRGIGDVNNDHSVNIVDALMIAQYYVGISGADAYLPFGDPSNDGIIDIVDALLVAKYYVGLVSEFQRKSPVDAVKAWADVNHVNLTGYGTFLYGTKEIAAVLPGYSFVIIIHIEHPVANTNIDPALGTNSIAAVDKNLGVEIINSTDSLVRFFQAHQIPAAGEKMLLTVKAWLGLSQELKDDGFYSFTIREDSLRILPIDSIQAEGISEVTGGGSGAIKANILFGTASHIIYNVVEQVELVEGIRPVCQSTKLLDKDPIVRRMAEGDLLSMGTSCLDYLSVQHAKAAPRLKVAIDAIYQKIMKQEERLRKIRTMLGR
jgi:hypothetical protein